jgi:hypothetical protein
MLGQPDGGPARLIALLVVIAVMGGVALGLWLFGALT